MSATLDVDTDWNHRAFGQRLVVIKSKNDGARKAGVLDVITGLTFVINVPANVPMEDLQPEKEYLANLKVFTSRNLDGVDKEFMEFFAALDIDQAMEDFIKAYWVYPSKIRFDLESIEEP